jgi:UDP-glucuronate decarboxylase
MHPSDGRVVSNFIVQALLGRDITLTGDGSQTRSFCAVDDLVTAMLAYMELDDAPPGPINLGNPNEITIGELADLVIEMSGSASKVIHIPLPKDDPTRRKPDIGRAMETLDWTPKVPLSDGLVTTIAYFQELLREIPASRISVFQP